MHSLINQITNIIATQSVNSIENNDIEGMFTSQHDFSSVIDNFNGSYYPANIAVSDTPNLPASSYTPLSLEISQFILTKQVPTGDETVELQGEIIKANFTQNFNDIETRDLNSVYVSSSNQNNSLTNGAIDTNTNIVTGNLLASNHIAHEGELNLSLEQLSQHAKSNDGYNASLQPNTRNVNHEINRDVNSVLGNKATKVDVPLNNGIEIDNNLSQVETLLKDKNLTSVKNEESNITKSVESLTNGHAVQVAKINSANTISDLDIKNIDEKPIASQSITPHSQTQELESLLPGKINKVNISSEYNNREEIQIAQKIEHGNLHNSQQKANNSEIDKPLVTSIEEITDNKSLYNVNQLNNNELNKSRFKNERLEINQQSLQNSNVNERHVIVNSLEKDILQDNINLSKNIIDVPKEIVKSQINEASIDKPFVNTISTEPLSSTNKVLASEKSLFQMPLNGEVKNGEDVAQQITWAKNNNANHVKIALSPEHLGALEINIEQDRDGLNIQFTTQNSLAKDALETFMPRLKDMLEQQGLNLQNTNVSQQNSGNNSNDPESPSEQYNNGIAEDRVDNLSQSVNAEDNASNSKYIIEAFA